MRTKMCEVIGTATDFGGAADERALLSGKKLESHATRTTLAASALDRTLSLTLELMGERQQG